MPNALTDPDRTGAVKGWPATCQGSQLDSERATAALPAVHFGAVRNGNTDGEEASHERTGLTRRAHGTGFIIPPAAFSRSGSSLRVPRADQGTLDIHLGTPMMHLPQTVIHPAPRAP
jgi:hypothetical protein